MVVEVVLKGINFVFSLVVKLAGFIPFNQDLILAGVAILAGVLIVRNQRVTPFILMGVVSFLIWVGLIMARGVA